MASSLKEWQEKEFNEIMKSKRSAIIEFGAPWCTACKLTEPMIADLELKYKDVSFAKIDVGKSPGLASKMGVMSLPNILLIKNGKVIDQIIGATTKKILEEKIKKI
jgi:thioredoxin 1